MIEFLGLHHEFRNEKISISEYRKMNGSRANTYYYTTYPEAEALILLISNKPSGLSGLF
jgi:hypothetical protein